MMDTLHVDRSHEVMPNSIANELPDKYLTMSIGDVAQELEPFFGRNIVTGDEGLEDRGWPHDVSAGARFVCLSWLCWLSIQYHNG